MEYWNADVVDVLYRPLQGELSLRLLRLPPGVQDQPIECELVPANLGDAAEHYEATSYTWGSAENPQVITCNGVNMKIQRNAFVMLNGVRLTDQPRTIWIDAICINQSDVDERASQVSMMRDIYRRAKNVLVWLGPSDDSSSIALAYARALDHATLVQQYTSTTEKWNELQESEFQQKSYIFDETNQSEAFRRTVFAILRFLQRPWFNRVWVQQEAALCRHVRVFCGADSVEWDKLFSLAWFIHPRQVGDYPEYVEAALGTLFHNLTAILEIQKFRIRTFNDTYKASRTAIYLLETLQSVRRFGATDPRDKVYAMQNLATDSDQWLEVDYRVPWQIVYVEVGRKCLENGWLDFLEDAGKAHHEEGSVLPSWAPDYRGGNTDSSIREHPSWMPGGGISGLGIQRPDSIGSVHQLPKAHRRKLELPKELRGVKGSRKQLLQSYASVKCTMSDEIVYLSKVRDELPPEINATYASACTYILGEDMRHIKKLKSQTYINSESALDAYRMSLISGRDVAGDIANSGFVQENWDSWMRWLEDGSPDEWEGGSRPPTFYSCVRASRVFDQFRFAITRHGYFCLVTRHAQTHDEVAIFPGYPLAVVIRPWRPPTRDTTSKPNTEQMQATGLEYHEFVGSTYIHGMMRNEAQCIISEFGCRYKPSEAQWEKISRASDSGNGEGWGTLGFSGDYSRILPTLGVRRVKLA